MNDVRSNLVLSIYFGGGGGGGGVGAGGATPACDLEE
jgi:hypothetical protein